MSIYFVVFINSCYFLVLIMMPWVVCNRSYADDGYVLSAVLLHLHTGRVVHVRSDEPRAIEVMRAIVFVHSIFRFAAPSLLRFVMG